MDPEVAAARLGDRVDEPADGRLSPQAEVLALRVVYPAAAPGRVDAGQSRHRVGVEAGGVHHCPRLYARVVAVSEDDTVRISSRSDPRGRGVEDDDGAVLLGGAAVERHQGVGVDDAGGGGEESGRRPHRGLHGGHFIPGEHPQVPDPALLRVLPYRLELFRLAIVRRDHDLARRTPGDGVFGAELPQEAVPLDAEARLHGSGGVIEAGVDDLAVAARCLLAERGVLLDDGDVEAREGELARAGQSDHARSNYQYIESFHICLYPGVTSFPRERGGRALPPVSGRARPQRSIGMSPSQCRRAAVGGGLT